MCYFLHGGINVQVSAEDLEKIENKSNFNFSIVSKAQEDGRNFPYITAGHCDCGTPIGSGNEKNKILTQEEEKELRHLAGYIQNLRKLKNIKYIWIQKLWAGDESQREQTVHIDDIDIIPFLVNLQEKCSYKIQLFKKLYNLKA